MDCQLAQQRILEAEDLRADLAANSALAEHVRGCPSCRQLVARLEDLTVAAKALPAGPGAAAGPSAAFLAQVKQPSLPESSARKLVIAPHSQLWMRRAVAAAIILVVGLTALSLCLSNPKTARGDTLLSDLAAWNLDLTKADPATRNSLYQQRVTELKQRVNAASLSPADRQIAQALLENADKQIQENDPLLAARRLSGIADQVLTLQKGATSQEQRAALDRAYQDLSQGARINLQNVQQSDPGKLTPDDQKMLRQLQAPRNGSGTPGGAYYPKTNGTSSPVTAIAGGPRPYARAGSSSVPNFNPSVVVITASPALPPNTPPHDATPTPPSPVTSVPDGTKPVSGSPAAGTGSNGTDPDASPKVTFTAANGSASAAGNKNLDNDLPLLPPGTVRSGVRKPAAQTSEAFVSTVAGDPTITPPTAPPVFDDPAGEPAHHKPGVFVPDLTSVADADQGTDICRLAGAPDAATESPLDLLNPQGKPFEDTGKPTNSAGDSATFTGTWSDSMTAAWNGKLGLVPMNDGHPDPSTLGGTLTIGVAATAATTPEPATALLVLAGTIAGLSVRRGRRRS